MPRHLLAVRRLRRKQLPTRGLRPAHAPHPVVLVANEDALRPAVRAQRREEHHMDAAVWVDVDLVRIQVDAADEIEVVGPLGGHLEKAIVIMITSRKTNIQLNKNLYKPILTT